MLTQTVAVPIPATAVMSSALPVDGLLCAVTVTVIGVVVQKGITGITTSTVLPEAV